ncbi:hypothetical protein, partial [Streptomyces sp. st140]|uniref:hypothetical protein n=1 Tax=Streptomyces sp. st140 TaxID=1828052 RepID=UPI001C54D37C
MSAGIPAPADAAARASEAVARAAELSQALTDRLAAARAQIATEAPAEKPRPAEESAHGPR